ncbi:MAG: helix-turn-helix domain-containing protein [Kiritimatiellia bacterium]
MALGNILREAREARGLSTSEVAEHTNMMVQIVEELEKEDFHRIAAPIYGRGFLKLYAELLDIDVQPLIDEFMNIYTGRTAPVVQRKENVSPPEVEKPIVPLTPGKEQPQEAGTPEKVEIVPRKAVRSLEGASKPLSEKEPVVPADAPEDSAPAPSVSEALDDAEEKNNPDAAAMPPEAGGDLFSADEPNLFNTTPLHERIAEAKRMMEEKEAAEKDQEEQQQKKKISLHLGRNQSLPVFQIGGRMGQSYETENRKKRYAENTERFMGTFLRTCGEFFREHRIRVPFNFSTRSSRTVFVYGSFGFIVLVLILLGISMIFRLTSSSDSVADPDATSVSVAVSETGEKTSMEPHSDNLHDVPPPPDMYFD